MALGKNIETLTGIRGYAALWVMFYHLGGNAYFQRVWTSGESLKHGFWGVDVFFVLSGFVLSHVYIGKFSESVSPKAYFRFLGLRFARMYPLHLVTFLGVLFCMVLSNTVGHGAMSLQSVSVYDAIMNLALLHAWGTTENLSWNGPSWSISAEWFAYSLLLVPYVRLLRKHSLLSLYMLTAVAWCLLIFVYVPMRPEKNLDITTFAIVRIIPEFLAGYVAYRTAKEISFRKHLWDTMGIVGFATILLVTQFDFLRVLLLPAIMLLIIGLSGEERISSLLMGNRVSVFLGEISFSIYMCHAIILWLVYPVTERLGLIPSLGSGLVVVAAYVAVVTLTSYLLYRFVERPCRDAARARLDSFFRRQPDGAS